MAFIDTVPEDAATGRLAEPYDEDITDRGSVANFTRSFALRPDVLDGWVQVVRAIRSGMDPSRYELATLAAARALRSTYCAIAHERVLRDRFYDSETVRRIATNQAHGDLTPTDVDIMNFAERVARDATSIGSGDIERLRSRGLTDTDILTLVFAAAARCFFSTVLDAAGVQADAALSEDSSRRCEPRSPSDGRHSMPAARPRPWMPVVASQGPGDRRGGRTAAWSWAG